MTIDNEGSFNQFKNENLLIPLYSKILWLQIEMELIRLAGKDEKMV